MKLQLSPTVAEKQAYFELVRQEWSEDFSEICKKYDPELVLGLEGEQVVVGLAVFRGEVPESLEFEPWISKYREEGCPYIGYFVVRPDRRSQGLGTDFLLKFRELAVFEGAFIVTENRALVPFYEKLGFVSVHEIEGEVLMRW